MKSVRTWWLYVLLCLLGAMRGLLAGAFPTSSTTLLSASTGCAVAALVVFLLQHRATRISHTPRFNSRILLGGVLLLSGPLSALLLTGHGINPNSLTLALALVPVVTAVAQNALSDTAPGSFAARTWPALAALTGLLLLIPQPSFANPVIDVDLLLAPLATGIGAALYSTSPSSRNQPPTLTPTLSAAALFFVAVWLVQFLLHHTTAHLAILAALLDAATALFMLLALSRIGLARWSAQFAVVPLAVILQGFILLHPAFDAYSTAGIALLLLGCVFLLLPQPTEKPA